MEVKSFAAFPIVELKADAETRTVEGWASVYDVMDSYRDIVMPGAFAKTLKKGMPAMLWQHDSTRVLGAWTEAEETDRGLRVKGKLAPTPLGDEVYALLQMNALKRMSIGYMAKKHEYDREKEIRKLLEVDLLEVSLVTFPANEKAKVTRVKSVMEMTEREFEEHLRDVGLSDEAAKIVITRGFKALGNQRDAEATALDELTNVFNQIKGLTS